MNLLTIFDAVMAIIMFEICCYESYENDAVVALLAGLSSLCFVLGFYLAIVA